LAGKPNLESTQTRIVGVSTQQRCPTSPDSHREENIALLSPGSRSDTSSGPGEEDAMSHYHQAQKPFWDAVLEERNKSMDARNMFTERSVADYVAMYPQWTESDLAGGKNSGADSHIFFFPHTIHLTCLVRHVPFVISVNSTVLDTDTRSTPQ
jgi:hypothetical protein